MSRTRAGQHSIHHGALLLTLLSASLGAQAQESAAPASANAAQEAASSFDNSFLHRVGGREAVDLSVFAFSNRVLPGMRHVMVRLNNVSMGMREIDFQTEPGKEDAQACLTVPMLKELGVKVEALPAFQTIDAQDCRAALNAIPSAFTAFDADTNVLNVSIPQAALDMRARGWISPELWDDGATSFWTSYRVSYNRSRLSGGLGSRTDNTTFASLRSGLNLGAWRLRATGTYYDSGHQSKWDWGDFYAERAINAWRGVFRMGDSSTSGDVFTAVRLRGVQLRSDEGMLPDSQRGYAPVIRGIANGYAKVTVRQQGNVIYSTFVPAGPFVIDDLYSTPGAGDLEVEVQEVGGRTTTFVQPFAALPMMMREGVWKYSFGVGEHRHNYHTSRPWLGQATLAYGLPFGLTAYGGGMVAQYSYQSAAVGVAWNLEHLGAISTDVTVSRAEDRRGERNSGYAARMQYAKSFPGSGTDFTLAGYRYNSDGYRSLDDAMRDRAYDNRYSQFSRQHEYQLSMTQRVGERSSMSINYFGVSYRNAPRNATYARAGFSSSMGRVGYAVNYGVSRSPWNERSTSIMLSLNIPLGARTTVSYTLNHTNNQGTSNDVGLSGALNEDYSLTYALQTGVSNGSGNNGNHGYASLGYQMPVASANLTHAYARHTSSTNLDLSGAIVIDKGGPLLGQSIGEQAIIVDAPGAAGAVVDSYPGVRTNAQGRALVPYASAYRENRISLTPNFDDPSATLTQNVQSVVPTRGAIVVARFDTTVGRAMLLQMRDAKGQLLPFGAAVYDTEGKQRGIIGPVGRLWLTGLSGDAGFVVKWGDTQEHQCKFNVDVSDIKGKSEMNEREVTCSG